MARIRYATVAQDFHCAWKCVQCKQIVVEKGRLSRFDSARGYGDMGGFSNAYDKADRAFERAKRKLIKGVNGHKSYRLLNTKGLCPHCSQKQPWVQPTQLKIILCTLFIIALFALTLLNNFQKPTELIRIFGDYTIPYQLVDLFFDRPVLSAILLSLILAPFLWLLVGVIHDRIAIRQLKDCEPACYPLVVAKYTPVDVAQDDERFEAVQKITGQK